jgi:CO/xanthine dehydrogenase Mo-binding subunit
VRTEARHGTPQSRFGQEIQLDKIRERLALDPADLRLRIVEQPETLTANYLRVGTIGLAECIRRVTRAATWSERFRKLPPGRGVGLACSSYLSGAGLPIYWNDMPHSGVQLKLDRSGGVTAFCGATEIGQGSDDVLVACVAEVLGIDPIDIRAVTGDTDLTPVDLGSYSSRVTLMMGNAAIQAAERARDLLADAVSKKLSVPRDRLLFAERRVFDTEDPAVGVSFSEAVCLAETLFGTLGTTGRTRHRDRPPDSRAAAWGRRPPTPTPPPSSRSTSISPPAGSTCRASGSRTTSAVRSIRRSSRAGRRQRLHGARRSADGGTDVPPAAAEALARSGAQVSFDAGVQEPDDARHARGVH